MCHADCIVHICEEHSLNFNQFILCEEHSWLFDYFVLFFSIHFVGPLFGRKLLEKINKISKCKYKQKMISSKPTSNVLNAFLSWFQILFLILIISYSHLHLLSLSHSTTKSNFTPSCLSNINRFLFFPLPPCCLFWNLNTFYLSIDFSYFIPILLAININNSLHICHVYYFSLTLNRYSFFPHLMNCLQSCSKMNEIQQTYYTIPIYI